MLPGHDAVVNFAAETHVNRSFAGSRPFVQIVVAANTLFGAPMRADVERFLHISTAETYGSIAEGSFREGDTLEPNSPYAASKAAADLLARAYGVTYGYPITVTRPANNFRPYHYPEKLVALFVTNPIDGEPVPVYGTGDNVRDWTYVDDNAAAQWLVVTEGEPGEVYKRRRRQRDDQPPTHPPPARGVRRRRGPHPLRGEGPEVGRRQVHLLAVRAHHEDCHRLTRHRGARPCRRGTPA